MKRILFSGALLLSTLWISSSVQAQDDDHKGKSEPKFKKEKSYSKSYSLSGGDRVSLTNQFGEMKISTWDKNEIKVDVKIVGKSDDEGRAQQILDRISIQDSKSSGVVSYKTKFEDENKNEDKKSMNGHKNEGMEINYAVYLPANSKLSVENQFGKTVMPDYSGELVLETKFGSLEAGRLTNTKEVTVEFGNATIAQINGGKLAIKFSNGTVNKLSGDIDTDLEFSRVKLNVDNDTKGLDINNSYSEVFLDLDKSLSATYDINTTHGGFVNKTGFTIQSEKEDNHGPNFSKRYKGTSGSGALKIRVNSSFGEITAGHDLQVDMKSKNKSHNNKNKHKETI